MLDLEPASAANVSCRRLNAKIREPSRSPLYVNHESVHPTQRFSKVITVATRMNHCLCVVSSRSTKAGKTPKEKLEGFGALNDRPEGYTKVSDNQSVGIEGSYLDSALRHTLER